ncbi:MAG TPA: XRE family transcriptional regulator [Planctomycetota bacterium]|nr:XRE family transcriptional regulator [Planctomycetota bacterium]
MKTRSTEGSKPAKSPRATNLFCDRVRELRRKKIWSLDELSKASGVSRSMLSQIERNRVNPTVAVAQSIAQAFGVPLGSLVDGAAYAPSLDVIRAADRTYRVRTQTGSEKSSCEIRTLSPLHLEKRVEFYELRFVAGCALRSAPHFTGTRELLTVTQGSLRVTSGRESSELGPGDSAYYHADVPHAIENIGRGPAVAFLIDLYTSL